MIKKSLRAYISDGQLEFAVLLHGEVVWVFLLQLGKQNIHGRLKFLVVLSGLRCVDELQQREEVFSSGSASYQMYPIRAQYKRRSALTQKSSEDFSPSPLVLAMMTLTNLRMSFSDRM